MKTMKVIAAIMLATVISTSADAQNKGRKGRELPRVETMKPIKDSMPAGRRAPTNDTTRVGRGAPENRQPMVQKKIDGLSQKLGLSDEQKTNFEQISQQQNDQLQAIRQNPNQTPEEKCDAMKGVLQNTDTKIQGILNTTDQRANYEKLKEERKTQFKNEQDRKKMREINQEIDSENLFK